MGDGLKSCYLTVWLDLPSSLFSPVRWCLGLVHSLILSLPHLALPLELFLGLFSCFGSLLSTYTHAFLPPSPGLHIPTVVVYISCFISSSPLPPPPQLQSPLPSNFSFSHQLIITTFAIPFEFRRDFALLPAPCSSFPFLHCFPPLLSATLLPPSAFELRALLLAPVPAPACHSTPHETTPYDNDFAPFPTYSLPKTTFCARCAFQRLSFCSFFFGC